MKKPMIIVLALIVLLLNGCSAPDPSAKQGMTKNSAAKLPEKTEHVQTGKNEAAERQKEGSGLEDPTKPAAAVSESGMQYMDSAPQAEDGGSGLAGPEETVPPEPAVAGEIPETDSGEEAVAQRPAVTRPEPEEKAAEPAVAEEIVQQSAAEETQGQCVAEEIQEPPVTEEIPNPQPPAPEPEPVEEKSIYDYPFDAGAIRMELIGMGQSMGLLHRTEDDGIPCTPDTRSWASPVTASGSFQGQKLKRALENYITSMPSVISAYGGTQITCFTIYVQDNGGVVTHSTFYINYYYEKLNRQDDGSLYHAGGFFCVQGCVRKHFAQGRTHPARRAGKRKIPCPVIKCKKGRFMNMATKLRERGRRLLSAFLCFLMVFGSIQTTALAFIPQEGQRVSSGFGDYYMGSDGDYYYAAHNYSFIVYDSDGNISVKTREGGNKRRKYVISDGSETRQVYCIESGVSYEESDNEYVSQSGTNSAYFQNLPYTAQYGIMLTSVYGWQPGKASPVEGTNEDDYAIATQILMWEYQQQNRISPFELQDNPAGIQADNFLRTIDGRPARRCYDWLLEQMARHATVPGFASPDSGSAPVHTLRYNPATGQYSLTIEDAANTQADLKIPADSGISVTRNGNQYTFTTDRMLSDPVTISAQKNVPGVANDLLLWGRVGYQALLCGAQDPVVFFMKFNTETYGTGRIKKTSEDGKVEGIRFRITGNGVDETVTTGADGMADIQLMPGTYTVTEQDIDRYETQAAQTVTILSGQVSTVTFDNRLKRGSLEVIKTSEDKFVEDMTFHLYGTSLSGLPVDEYAKTDASGVARFENVLVSGSTPYTLEEVGTPERYVVPDGQTAPVEWNKVTRRSVSNILKKFRVQVTKTDAKTGYAQGDASLAGAVYGLYDDGSLVASYTTDASGSFTSDYFTCGKNWTLREISPSEGYLLDGEVYHIPAEPGNYTFELNQVPMGVTEDVIMGRIRLVKHIDEELGDIEKTGRVAAYESGSLVLAEPAGEASGTSAGTQTEAQPDPYAPVPVDEGDIRASGGQGLVEQPEAAARFQVYLQSSGSYDAAREDERDFLTTDADGFAVSKDLPYGRYVVHQTDGLEGQAFIEDFVVDIKKDEQTYSYILNNTTRSSYLRVEKHDIETGNIIPAAGVGFQIRSMSTGELVSQTVYYPTPVTIDTFFTNEEGWMMLPEELPHGQYELMEVETCYGYVLDSTPVPFTVDGTDNVVVVEKHNMAQKGKISIEKTGEVFALVSSREGGDKEGATKIYQPVYEIRSLAGAAYEIRAAEDIYTPDGTLRASAGEVVDTVTTTGEGPAASRELYLGKYEITEIEAPYGMVLNREVRTVELVYAGQEVAVTETQAGFYNERQKVELSLEKTLETDEIFGIGMKGEMANVTFGLYAAEDIAAADGSAIPKDGLIEIVALDADGHGTAKTDLPLGSYYFKEYSTDGHYLWSDEKYPVEFSYAGQDTALVTVAANDGEPIPNELLYGSVSGKKKDEDGNGLAGAKIGLFAGSETEFTEENAILLDISKDDGSFSFQDVPFGKWIIREIEQPEGFVLSEEQFPVSINKDAQVIEIEMTNRYIRGGLHLTKYDRDYPENRLSGAVFEVYRDSNKNGVFDEGDELLGTMEETDIGQYEMKDIRYGGVFVKEKTAPEGFYLDENVYYAMIDTDGKTYEIENEAGKGFYNEAFRGSLKIVKTSSDGRVEGFSFRVTGEHYDQVFTTDANGEILIENLRVGTYTVTEVEDDASAGYIRPEAATVELVKDETLVLNVHNEKIPPSAPKTGDDSRTWMWLGLAVIGADGLAATAYGTGRRKKKAGADEA